VEQQRSGLDDMPVKILANEEGLVSLEEHPVRLFRVVSLGDDQDVMLPEPGTEIVGTDTDGK